MEDIARDGDCCVQIVCEEVELPHRSSFKWVFHVQHYRFYILLPCWGIQVILYFSLLLNKAISYPNRLISLVKCRGTNTIRQTLVMVTCNQKTLCTLLIYPLTPSCFPCRIFPRTSGECRKILKRHVCPDIRHAVHAELGGVPGPLHRAEEVLHRRQCELGGNAE